MKIVNDIFRASGRFVVVFTIISRPFIVVFIRTHRIGVCVCVRMCPKKKNQTDNIGLSAAFF